MTQRGHAAGESLDLCLLNPEYYTLNCAERSSTRNMQDPSGDKTRVKESEIFIIFTRQ